MKTTKEIGFAAEDRAKAYLLEQGLHFLEANFTTRVGEIDLIMQDKQFRVFVEVRLRNRRSRVSALESVTFQKQQKLRKTALLYLQKHRLLDKVACRFDIVAIDDGHIQWLKNAF